MIYLIDFENVHEEGFSSLGRLGEKDSVYCFFTRNVAKISMSALAGIRSGQLHFVEAESGKQSLDLALVSYLGYLIGTKSQEQCFEIVSNDNGFTKVAEFWNKRGTGIRVRVRKTAEQRQKPEPEKSPAVQISGEAPVSSGNGLIQQLGKSLDPLSANNADDSKLTAAESEEKASDPGLLTALTACGISASAAEFLQNQVEKYRADKNVKQMVYRAVVKKYGQKTGTQIYNSAKKIMLK